MKQQIIHDRYKQAKLVSSLALCFLPIAFLPNKVFAANNPTGSNQDSRIKYANYHPDQVYNIYAKYGEVSLVELEADERIDGDSSGLALGDAAAWQVAVKGRNIIFKPTQKAPSTNMVITTNKRTYVFNLMMANAHHPTTFLLRFRYPSDQALRNQKIEQEKTRKRTSYYEATKQASQQSGRPKNMEYFGYGNRSGQALRPTAMFDDGLFTYIEFDNAKALPAVFKVEADGSETLVNTHIEGKYIIVHELAETFHFRLGNAVLGIKNQNYDKTGVFNKTGTSKPNTVRLKRGN